MYKKCFRDEHPGYIIKGKEAEWDDTLLRDAYERAHAKVHTIMDLTPSEHIPDININECAATVDWTWKPLEIKTISWRVGMRCRAIFKEDGKHYEAIIESIKNDRACVKFEGYNNEVRVKLNALKPSLGEEAVMEQFRDAHLERFYNCRSESECSEDYIHVSDPPNNISYSTSEEEDDSGINKFKAEPQNTPQNEVPGSANAKPQKALEDEALKSVKGKNLSWAPEITSDDEAPGSVKAKLQNTPKNEASKSVKSKLQKSPENEALKGVKAKLQNTPPIEASKSVKAKPQKTPEKESLKSVKAIPQNTPQNEAPGSVKAKSQNTPPIEALKSVKAKLQKTPEKEALKSVKAIPQNTPQNEAPESVKAKSQNTPPIEASKSVKAKPQKTPEKEALKSVKAIPQNTPQNEASESVKGKSQNTPTIEASNSVKAKPQNTYNEVPTSDNAKSHNTPENGAPTSVKDEPQTRWTLPFTFRPATTAFPFNPLIDDGQSKPEEQNKQKGSSDCNEQKNTDKVNNHEEKVRLQPNIPAEQTKFQKPNNSVGPAFFKKSTHSQYYAQASNSAPRAWTPQVQTSQGPIYVPQFPQRPGYSQGQGYSEGQAYYQGQDYPQVQGQFCPKTQGYYQGQSYPQAQTYFQGQRGPPQPHSYPQYYPMNHSQRQGPTYNPNFSQEYVHSAEPQRPYAVLHQCLGPMTMAASANGAVLGPINLPFPFNNTAPIPTYVTPSRPVSFAVPLSNNVPIQTYVASGPVIVGPANDNFAPGPFNHAAPLNDNVPIQANAPASDNVAPRPFTISASSKNTATTDSASIGVAPAPANGPPRPFTFTASLNKNPPTAPESLTKAAQTNTKPKPCTTGAQSKESTTKLNRPEPFKFTAPPTNVATVQSQAPVLPGSSNAAAQVKPLPTKLPVGQENTAQPAVQSRRFEVPPMPNLVELMSDVAPVAPPLPFPLAQSLSESDQIQSSMLLSWYSSGYYTGLYQAMLKNNKNGVRPAGTQ